MSVNSMNFEDSSVILNAIYEQVTGIKGTVPLDETAFVSMGNTTLKQGYDKLLTGVSIVLSKQFMQYESILELFQLFIKIRLNGAEL